MRQGLSNGTIIFILTLNFFIMFGGVFLIYYAVAAHPAQLRAQATATVGAVMTSDAQSTSTVIAQATAIAKAQANTAATAQVQAQATTTALQDIYNRATSGTPVLNSSLAFQTRPSWDIYTAQGGGGCGFAGNALQASTDQKHTYVPCFAHATNFNNFAFEVGISILQGDAGGILFRANAATTQFYIFQIERTGRFEFLLSKDTTHNTLLVYDTSSSIKTGPGQPNLLSVVAQGSSIYLYINKQFVGSANDSTYTSGEIGVLAADTNNATTVAFNNAQVWQL